MISNFRLKVLVLKPLKKEVNMNEKMDLIELADHQSCVLENAQIS